MELETRLVLIFTIIGLVALIPFIAATYGSPSIYHNSPSGMILGAIQKQTNESSPHTRNMISSPDGYNETIETPYGKFFLSMHHDKIIYQLEGDGKRFVIIEEPGQRSKVLTTTEYVLNITVTPFNEIEEIRTPGGYIRKVLEDGMVSNYTSGSNSSYLENLLETSHLAMVLMENEISAILEGVSIPGSRISGIYINEFLPDPGTNGTEWIELFNNMSSSVNIGGWVLDDMSGGSDPYTIPAGTNISSKGFVIFYANYTEIQLNNGGDSVRLFDSGGNLIDSITYDPSMTNASIARVPDGSFFWTNLTAPTPGGSNS